MTTPAQKTETIAVAVADLRRKQAEHPFWENRLFEAITRGWLTREDMKYVFSQYYCYSRNFTRYIAAVMANCDNDLFRSQLSENLWEEGGATEPEKRHSQIFRNFLRDSFQINEPERIEFAEFTRFFMREYLVYCLRSTPSQGAAFLSLGTEGIVARMYEIFLEGLHKVGCTDEQLEFFFIHIQCDDGHAETLENMMTSYVNEAGWYETCLEAMHHALTLRAQFFENIFATLQHRRVQSVLDRIQAKRSLGENKKATVLEEPTGVPLYTNKIERLNVDFSVQRLEAGAEVLDPRMVRIPPGKFNEKHKHAHETIFYVIEGTGRVLVDEAAIEIKPGDVVFAPRWTLHQAQNTGPTEMRILAVTDFGLTGKAFMGDYEKTARLRAGKDLPRDTDPAE